MKVVSLALASTIVALLRKFSDQDLTLADAAGLYLMESRARQQIFT